MKITTNFLLIGALALSLLAAVLVLQPGKVSD